MDLTRVSLPAVYLRPYTLLEEAATRNFMHVDLLFGIPLKQDPLERLMGVLTWLLSLTKAENFNHKPINPVLGEVNKSYLKFASGEDVTGLPSTTYFVAEQVSHHPPITAIRLDNPTHKTSMMGHYTFNVKFHGNSVTVANEGSVDIVLGDETYVFKKAMPDILIRNVFEILGKHSVVWTGLMTIEATSGCRAECEFVVEGNANIMRGNVWLPEQDEPLYEFKGITGDKVYYYEPGWSKKEKKEKRTLLVDQLAPVVRRPCYIDPAKQEPNSSVNVWKDVARNVVLNEMSEADVAKKQVEDKQREYIGGLKEAEEEHEPVYFTFDEDEQFWKVKDFEWYTSYAPLAEEEEEEVTRRISAEGKKG